ncbi:LlaJI family restriction endonuclease [Fibrobacter sp. UWH4]|uniref:LlaJI family restriction endonuclease n=1 Tax=Fibrobacter sp. UWH4 TaxID=1896210 RepID=UPI00091F0F24|nr:LlaJI family restriction endonuclease [Fibrobacter sp. UWH4]SHK50352.1 LlaJI restriction endonuclease [Fibrobacter sp. UWH4]
MANQEPKHSRPKLSDVCVYGLKQEDEFVGIRYNDGDLKVYFPFGYSRPSSDEEQKYRDDILNLVSVLSAYSKESLGVGENRMLNDENVHFPIHAYIHVFNYFLNHGYYVENEPVYKRAKGGKINWSKTIKQVRPQIAGDFPNESVVYLDFVTKKSAHNENELITQIHKFCVYEAYEKIGCLFGFMQPEKAIVPFNAELFVSVLRTRMANTFNEKHLLLFQNMLDIICYMGKREDNRKASFGTNDFEYVWEGLIDHVFGIDDKDKYFPHCTWKIDNDEKSLDWRSEKRTALRPDTIMELTDDCKKIFILDAKYYQYPRTLPGTGSILKQIAYAEFIETQLRDIPDQAGNDIFNAFILPYAAEDGRNVETSYRLENFGYAECDWRKGDAQDAKPYERIYGILLDVRSIMQRHPKSSDKDIAELAAKIDNYSNIMPSSSSLSPSS